MRHHTFLVAALACVLVHVSVNPAGASNMLSDLLDVQDAAIERIETSTVRPTSKDVVTLSTQDEGQAERTFEKDACGPMPRDEDLRRCVGLRHIASTPQTDAGHTSTNAGPTSSLQLSAGQEDKRAVITLANVFKNGTQWQAKLSSSWDSTASSGDLATLDGLGRGFKAEIGINRLLFSPPTSQVRSMLDNVCNAARTHVRKPNAECDDQLYEQVTDIKILEDITEAYFGGRSRVPSVYASVSASRNDFEFFDENFSPRNDSRTGWGVAIGASILDPTKGWALYADYQRQRAYVDDTGSRATLCTPIDASPVERCVESFLQPPIAKDKNIFSLEYRRQKVDEMGLSVRVAYEKNEDVIGVSIPIYLLQNDKNGLSGGLRFGWNDRDRDLVAAVFVSAGFSLRK